MNVNDTTEGGLLFYRKKFNGYLQYNSAFLS
jgi:hypothetical protein